MCPGAKWWRPRLWLFPGSGRGSKCYPHFSGHFCLAPSKSLEPLGTPGNLSKDVYWPLRLHRAQAEAQHAGRHEPCESMLATGRKRLVGKGVPEGQPLSLFLESSLIFPGSFLSMSFARTGGGLRPKEAVGGGALEFGHSVRQQGSKTHLSVSLATHSFFVR